MHRVAFFQSSTSVTHPTRSLSCDTFGNVVDYCASSAIYRPHSTNTPLLPFSRRTTAVAYNVPSMANPQPDQAWLIPRARSSKNETPFWSAPCLQTRCQSGVRARTFNNNGGRYERSLLPRDSALLVIDPDMLSWVGRIVPVDYHGTVVWLLCHSLTRFDESRKESWVDLERDWPLRKSPSSMVTAHYPALIHVGGKSKRDIDEKRREGEGQRARGNSWPLIGSPRRITLSKITANSPSYFVILPVMMRARVSRCLNTVGPRESCLKITRGVRFLEVEGGGSERQG